jgi:hypothetical protein
VAVAGLALLAASCSSSSTAARPTVRETTPSAHPSPAQQVAAQGATRSFRSFVADAAVTVADDLATADQAAAAGNTSAAQAAAAAALLAYDQLRGQEGLVSTGADQAKLTDPNGEIDASSLLTLDRMLASGTSGASLAATLDGQGPTFELLLAHRALLPQDVALDAKRQLAWVALTTPVALGPNPPEGQRPADVASAAAAASAALTSVDGIGMLVDPSATARARAQMAQVESLLQSGGTTRQVVGATDATVFSVGQLAGSLAGYGVLVQGYQ